MKGGDGVRGSTNLIIRTLKNTSEGKYNTRPPTSPPNLLSLESVRLSGYPVDAVTVQAAGQAAVGRAAHLDCQVGGALYHAASQAGAGVGCNGLDPLSRHKQEREQKEGEMKEHLGGVNREGRR